MHAPPACVPRLCSVARLNVFRVIYLVRFSERVSFRMFMSYSSHFSKVPEQKKKNRKQERCTHRLSSSLLKASFDILGVGGIQAWHNPRSLQRTQDYICIALHLYLVVASPFSLDCKPTILPNWLPEWSVKNYPKSLQNKCLYQLTSAWIHVQ